MFYRGPFLPALLSGLHVQASCGAVAGFVAAGQTLTQSAAQGATQWKDAGWGPRAEDPWYHDRERHERRPRWVPQQKGACAGAVSF